MHVPVCIPLYVHLQELFIVHVYVCISLLFPSAGSRARLPEQQEQDSVRLGGSGAAGCI